MHITVTAIWDPDAGVWVATSDDIPGLVTEAPTVEALRVKVDAMIPELMELNDRAETRGLQLPITMKYEEQHTLSIA